ncbi:MAG: S41 family peptidase [Bacteroidota bacterium]|nr:S41 family peptidase [Bacteroidota bacterium]
MRPSLPVRLLLLLSLLAFPSQQALAQSGITPNGNTPNGNTPNGITPNGITPNGNTPNGSTRLLRFPDVHGDRVAFSYAGDIFIASTSGGMARQLTAHAGQELFPRFSPDGRWIAFSAEYSGTRQVYVMPSKGGEPRQLTYYNDVGVMPPRGGFDHQVLGWTPDGGHVLFRANRLPWGVRMGRFYTVPVDGGLETPLVIPEGGTGCFAPDGRRMVYTPISREWRTWKRTRGGRAQDIWMFDLEAVTAERLTDHVMTDNQPMWIGNTVYFTSDRGFTLNIYALDLESRNIRQVTAHSDYDVLWPSAGGENIVYQSGGWLWLLDTRSGETRKLDITVAVDGRQSLPVFKNVSANISSSAISPSGKRALFDARGDLFTVPARYGAIRNLTRTQGVREHSPAWSPDGASVAYVSDATGEYELWLRAADGSGEARQLTTGSATWIFPPLWSPDGRKLAYADVGHGLRVLDLESGDISDVARGRRGAITHYRWSPDSRWIAYSNAAPSDMTGIWVYSLASSSSTLLSSGYSNDFAPAFSADGRYMLFLSNRDFNLTFSSHEFRYVYTKATRVYAAALTADAPPFQPYRSDEEGDAATGTATGTAAGDSPAEKGALRVAIDARGFPDRITALPGAAASYFGLACAHDAVYYLRRDDGPAVLLRYDIGKQKEEEVISGISGYDLSHDGTHILYRAGGDWGIIPAQAGGKKGDGKLDLASMEMKIDRKAEWRQIFSDAWRLMRDWFYDPNMHGVDWKEMRAKYVPLLPWVERRSDLDFILGEMIGELNAGHTYVNAGDEPAVARVEGGLLGCEFADEGAEYYRIATVFNGENWHEAFRSPLTEHGVDVPAGSWLIAVDGREVKTGENPYKALENSFGKTLTLLVNDAPRRSGAREVTVTPVKSETELRFLHWVAQRRAMVDSASEGRIGYIWIPNTAVEGNRELFRWFYPQANRQALIIDDRYNGGGFIPYNMIELLDREALNYWARRDVEPFSAPDVFHQGPKACLINGYSSSGGDAFPYYFRKRGLGTLIGTRTWGGLIGLSGQPSFVDGGSLSIPTFRFFDEEGNWQIENEGVAPDIEVIDRPDAVARGKDPSLEKAIEVLLREIERQPPVRPTPPKPPDESR